MAEPRILTRDEVQAMKTLAEETPTSELTLQPCRDLIALAASHEALRARVEELREALEDAREEIERLRYPRKVQTDA